MIHHFPIITTHTAPENKEETPHMKIIISKNLPQATVHTKDTLLGALTHQILSEGNELTAAP